MYDKLVAKVNNINTSDFVLKTKYQTDKTELEIKITDSSSLVKKTDYNTKITKLENKIPDVNNLATKTALTAVENKIPNVSNLVNRTDYNNKVTEIENKLNNHNRDKYIDTSEFNKLAADVFNARLAQANLITKTDFDAKLLTLNRKITSNKTKHLLGENELNKLKTFDFGYFISKSHFDEDGTQTYLVFQPLNRYFKIDISDYVLSWKSKGLSAESITRPSAPNNFINPLLNYLGTKIRVRFSGSCLTHDTIVNIYIVYEINKKDNTTSSDPTLENCLFGAVTLTKNVEIDKYGYSGYRNGFDGRGSF